MCANINANGSVLPVPEWKIKKSNLLAFITDKSEKISCGNKSILQDHHEHLNCPLTSRLDFHSCYSSLPCFSTYMLMSLSQQVETGKNAIITWYQKFTESIIADFPM